jgi:hypothetical protein
MIQDFLKLAFKINAVSMYAYTNEHLWYPWKAFVVPQRYLLVLLFQNHLFLVMEPGVLPFKFVPSLSFAAYFFLPFYFISDFEIQGLCLKLSKYSPCFSRYGIDSFLCFPFPILGVEEVAC